MLITPRLPPPLLPLEDLAAGARFLWSLPRFLRQPVGVQHARAILRRRLELREADFLALVGRAIFANPASPYRQLLNLVGCEQGDLERLVAGDGVDEALRLLSGQGVYLTVDEFKGRRPVVRGSATLTLHPSRLHNPKTTAHFAARTGGSRGASTLVPIDLANIRERAVNRRLQMRARGAGWVHAIWLVPGAQSITLLEFVGAGEPPARCYTLVDQAAAGVHPRYRWSARAMRWASLLAGAPLPTSQYVSVDQPLPIVHWMAAVLRSGGTPHVLAPASAIVRLCQAAFEVGVELRGAHFTAGSEPLTTARLAAIRRAGAEVIAGYGTIEAGRIGFGCLAPAAPDDVHLLHDLVAVVQPGSTDERASLPPRALLITSLRPTAPFILLNVSLGDQAELLHAASGQCGCPLEQLGWTTHLHTIRSFEKLTAGGMTFLDNDVIRVLEDVLPAHFGGGPTDYQLVEDEAEGGAPRLRLLVHPRLGPLGEPAVAEAFLAAIGTGSGAERIMALQWRQAGVLQVERRAPLVTGFGKILHLHKQPSVAARE